MLCGFDYTVHVTTNFLTKCGDRSIYQLVMVITWRYHNSRTVLPKASMQKGGGGGGGGGGKKGKHFSRQKFPAT